MKAKPNFKHETHWLRADPNVMVIGVDEAGRGPWAGPVVAGAAWIAPDAVKDLPSDLADSKTLSEASRQRIYHQLKEIAQDHSQDHSQNHPQNHSQNSPQNYSRLLLASAAVSAADIDQIGILPATFRAMQMAVDQLTAVKRCDHVVLLVDGSLTPNLTTGAKHTHVEAIVKGDRHVLSIAAAAIIAKYDRDQDMLALAQKYPDYQWHKNKGYGTADHQSALDAYGVTPYHRTSFRPVARRLMK